MRRRKPTRRDLLVVIGELQNIVGEARAANNDRNPDRQGEVDQALDDAHAYCIEALSHDEPIWPPSGPWAAPNRRKKF